MKNCYVSDLSEGARIDDIFLINGKTLAEARNGSQYIRLQLSDRTGTIDAFKWDANQQDYDSLRNIDIVRVRGNVKTHNGKLQIVIDSFRRPEDKLDPADFLPRSEYDIDVMFSEMMDIIKSVKNPHLKTLLDHFFQDEGFADKFKNAPAAMKIHHAYIGGLLEHSLSVAKLCDTAAIHYPGIDRDLLIAGAILHDMGKIEELSWSGPISYTNSGHFLGHIVVGAMLVIDAAENIEGFDPILKLLLAHMIIAHHGEKEHGSPKRPKFAESLILHYIEDMDAKVNIIRQEVAKSQAGSEDTLWTERNWVLERPLFKGMPQAILADTAEENESLEELVTDYDPFADE